MIGDYHSNNIFTTPATTATTSTTSSQQQQQCETYLIDSDKGELCFFLLLYFFEILFSQDSQ
jgi:hypothetical protein